MKKNIIMTVLALVLSVSTLFFAGTPVQAASCGSAKQCIDQGLSASGTSSTPNSLSSVLTTVTNILLFLMGAVSVIMIIIGGFRYVISGGKKESVTNAKNTILYAIVGLLVAVFAYAIINFILGAALSGGSTTNV